MVLLTVRQEALSKELVENAGKLQDDVLSRLITDGARPEYVHRDTGMTALLNALSVTLPPRKRPASGSGSTGTQTAVSASSSLSSVSSSSFLTPPATTPSTQCGGRLTPSSQCSLHDDDLEALEEPVLETVRLLCSHGADPNYQRKTDGLFALMLAAQSGWNSVVEFLVCEAKADVNAVNSRGQTRCAMASVDERLSYCASPSRNEFFFSRVLSIGVVSACLRLLQETMLVHADCSFVWVLIPIQKANPTPRVE